MKAGEDLQRLVENRYFKSPTLSAVSFDNSYQTFPKAKAANAKSAGRWFQIELEEQEAKEAKREGNTLCVPDLDEETKRLLFARQGSFWQDFVDSFLAMMIAGKQKYFVDFRLDVDPETDPETNTKGYVATLTENQIRQLIFGGFVVDDKGEYRRGYHDILNKSTIGMAVEDFFECIHSGKQPSLPVLRTGYKFTDERGGEWEFVRDCRPIRIADSAHVAHNKKRLDVVELEIDARFCRAGYVSKTEPAKDIKGGYFNSLAGGLALLTVAGERVAKRHEGDENFVKLNTQVVYSVMRACEFGFHKYSMKGLKIKKDSELDLLLLYLGKEMIGDNFRRGKFCSERKDGQIVPRWKPCFKGYQAAVDVISEIPHMIARSGGVDTAKVILPVKVTTKNETEAKERRGIEVEGQTLKAAIEAVNQIGGQHENT